MKQAIIIFTIAACSLSCTNTTGFKDEGGLLYHVCLNKNGKNMEEGDFTALKYTEKTEEGTVLYDSDSYDCRPVYKFREPSAFRGDFFAGLGMLSEGDSAIFKINLDSIIAKTHRMRPETAGKYLIYTVKVNKVIKRGGLSDSLYNQAIQAFKQTEIEHAKQREASKITSFIAGKKLDPVVTASGLNYVLVKNGEGQKAAVGDSVEVNYIAKYLSGKVFETNSKEAAKKAQIFNPLRKYLPMKIVISNQTPTSGFQEAVRLFPPGAKATLIIPSKLAYGPNSYREIQPFTPLLCDLEVTRILRHK